MPEPLLLDPDGSMIRLDAFRPGRKAAHVSYLVLECVLPVSASWRKVGAPPADLRRWDNCAVCFARGPDGPTLVIYWFAPDLHYWYGTTPAARGVTGKTARGHSRGAIAGLVADVAYGEDARRRGARFAKSRPLPFRSRVGSQLRRQWRDGEMLYDETFFSIGQVTIEVLLRIRQSDVELLEPELRWLCGHVRER